MRLLRTKRKAPSAQIGHLPTDGFSTKQLTALAVAFMVAVLLLPVGARAANALINVVITDPTNTSRQAHVDANGNVQVTGGVSVTNTPDVSVANTPDVNVANTPDVNVANSGPLSVHEDADVRAFWTALGGFMGNGDNDAGDCETLPHQPVGTRFVIDYLNADAFGPVGSGPFLLSIDTNINNTIANGFVVPLEFQAVTTNGAHYAASLPVKLYNDLTSLAGFGGPLCFHVVRTGVSGEALVDLLFSGHLIDWSS
jgi:hypothetical protein